MKGVFGFLQDFYSHKWEEEETGLKVFDQCGQLFLTVVNMHKACVYLSYYGAVTFFLQMEPVRQEEGAHVKQNTTHAMQREKQHAMQYNIIQYNTIQYNTIQYKGWEYTALCGIFNRHLKIYVCYLYKYNDIWAFSFKWPVGVATSPTLVLKLLFMVFYILNISIEIINCTQTHSVTSIRLLEGIIKFQRKSLG